MENKNINIEFITWLEDQECYPFIQGLRLRQSLYAGEYVGRKTVKQKLDEKQKYK
jgi:hypothetical protein